MIGMKKSTVFSLLLLSTTSFLAGCGKEEEAEQFTPQTMPSGQMNNVFVPGNQASSMILDKKNITLSSAAPSDSTIVRLACGCDFSIVPESFTGDTNVIKHTRYPSPVPEAFRVGMVFSADQKAPKGNYSVKFAFLNTGSKGDYRDTITVNYSL
jgi:hypothetical protein